MHEQTAVIVPVMRRPRNAAPFMESLRASLTGCWLCVPVVYAIADWQDQETVRAWTAAGARVFYDHDRDGRAGTFAEKVNWGYRNTTEPWLFLAGDDVRFHPGWLDSAQATAAETPADVVGTNDLVNPRVVSGQHGTHLLIRRSYVDTVGASWDGPGVLCHEGYRHWYVDDEIVTVAKQRSTWASSPMSVVEHLHPLFGRGVDDEVYQLGRSHAVADGTLFRRRLADHAR